ncbi:MAG: hypothetical protein M1828_004470 [Chrysothrix sp. TS-e1954]|nr:MAG: hypothetical protein M1828_004470 [Chrysothrix sp. TS-e1954]
MHNAIDKNDKLRTTFAGKMRGEPKSFLDARAVAKHKEIYAEWMKKQAANKALEAGLLPTIEERSEPRSNAGSIHESRPGSRSGSRPSSRPTSSSGPGPSHGQSSASTPISRSNTSHQQHLPPQQAQKKPSGSSSSGGSRGQHGN